MGVSRAERMTIHSCIQNDDTFATLIDEKSTINPYDFIAFFIACGREYAMRLSTWKLKQFQVEKL